MDRHNGLTLRDEREHIRQSIGDILTTPIGTRVMRRDYGSQLSELIDRPINSVLALQIAAASVMAIKRWEPRVEVTRFRPYFDPSRESGITADIECTYRGQVKLQLNDLRLK